MKKSNERGKINMKKIAVFLLTVMLLLSLTACGGGDKPADDNPPADASSSGAEAGDKEQTGSPDAGAASSVEKASEGTLELSTANLAIVINGKAVAIPYALNEIFDAGVPVNEAVQEIELGAGEFFSPNIFIDEAENYVICPAYYNESDSAIPITEAQAEEITMYTYAETPEDQNISILGIDFGMSKAEVKDILGEPMWDEGDIYEWLVTVSDDALEGNFRISFMSDSDDAGISMIDLSVYEN